MRDDLAICTIGTLEVAFKANLDYKFLFIQALHFARFVEG